MPMIEKSSASSFRIRAGIRSDFQPHDIVVHVESASDFEIAFAQFAHTHPFVEFYGFVMAIYVESIRQGAGWSCLMCSIALRKRKLPACTPWNRGRM